MKTRIKNATIVHPENMQQGDILLENGKIVAVGDGADQRADHVYDASGLFAFPGFIDMHVHLDAKIMNYSLADDYVSGSRVAVKNGITTLFSFITQGKQSDLAEDVKAVKNHAASGLFCNLGWHITPVRWDEETFDEIETLIDRGQRSFKFYTTYRMAGLYRSYAQIEGFAQRFGKRDITILVHCEDDQTIASAQRSVDTVADYAALRTPEAEVLAISQIIKICVKTQCHFHVVHVSTAEGARLIAEAASKCPITCETAPQYLFLNDDVFHGRQGLHYLCTPPLRAEHNRAQLLEQFYHGAINVLATDHCPFTMIDKATEYPRFDAIPKGLCGLDFLVPLAFNLFQNEPDGLQKLCAFLSAEPARILELDDHKGRIKPGYDADITLVRLGEPHTLQSRDGLFNPYENRGTNITVEAVFLRGIQVVRDAVLLELPPQGELL